ncbi:MAG TPA: iron-containing alcohol dehydrogenase [Bacteroidales bacterium]|nr:iron-containing alcohol dehydrogenase [Bacteroidales bacterium]HRZ48038.1 iron-containing alcohol dehydrogenase [Bacteroidales bacterium]
MENFTIYNPVKVHFGAGVVEQLGAVIAPIHRKVLLVYGQGAIRKNGVYDLVMQQLHDAGCEVWEYGGIKSNPIIEDVDAAAELGRHNGVGVVLAVGGGSVIDSVKIIAAAIVAQCSAWDLVSRKTKPTGALPVVTVLTLAATGTEMNPFAVVQNQQLGIKTSFSSPYSFPVHSFLDPAFTLSVPSHYTGYGIADLMAHVMEAWFGKGDSPLADKIVVSILQEAMEAGPQLMGHLQDYNLRARVMYAATLALNGTTMHGRLHGDWGVHAAGHVLSLLYGVPHGASLTIVYPTWLRLMKDRETLRVQKLLGHLFQTTDIEDGIQKLEGFFKSINCPVRLGELNLPATAPAEIVDQMIRNRVSGMHHQLSSEDYRTLVSLME